MSFSMGEFKVGSVQVNGFFLSALITFIHQSNKNVVSKCITQASSRMDTLSLTPSIKINIEALLKWKCFGPKAHTKGFCVDS